MAMKMSGGAQTSMSDINITPLVDVMLVLLVIFMVTAPMMSAKKTEAKLPPVDTGETINLSEDDLILEVTLNKTIKIYGCDSCIEMNIFNLQAKMKHNQKAKSQGKLYIYGDQRLKYRFILQVMDQLNKAGVPRVGLITNPTGLDLLKK
ncbi:MAG: protein TolR [Deltaproteobacteria bacterium]|nr:protein TolR [Deltaproteobacteria bacterium]MBU54367.1 protein TolR [Deltaproteobacteria bacterium]|tara:strand:- start:6425 stop:6871 length:447 start_codon:yes stop_codon:yes gene_type:complete